MPIPSVRLVIDITGEASTDRRTVLYCTRIQRAEALTFPLARHVQKESLTAEANGYHRVGELLMHAVQ
jgi:hypothetical protein